MLEDVERYRKGGKSVRMTVKLSEFEFDEMIEAAAQYGISQSNYIRLLIKQERESYRAQGGKAKA